MRRPLLLFAAHALSIGGTGCGWPDHQFDGASAVGDAGSSDDAEVSGEDAAALPAATACPPAPDSAGFCAELREFDGRFTLDGAGEEFCRQTDVGSAMPPRRFTVASAARTWPQPAPAYPERFEVRAGLDAFGVHVFVQVLEDPRISIHRSDPMKGDAVEIFLRGNIDRVLDGSLEADEAHHLVLTPPVEGAPGVAFRYLRGVPQSPVSDAHWASRRVRSGWEVELHYPWTVLKNQASPGMVMGFDIAIDLDDDGTPGRDVRAIMHISPVASSPSCDALLMATADPLCDDRTWCLAKAYIP